MIAADRQMASKPSATEKRGRLADPTHPQWIPWVVESLADPAAKKGFDGFVLSLGGEAATPAARGALLNLAATLRQRYPDKRLLLDLRSGLGAEAANVADGFPRPRCFTRVRVVAAVPDWTPIADVQRLTRHIRQVQMKGMRVFAVDYAPPHMTAPPPVRPRSASPPSAPFHSSPRPP
jgi:hypothetical protein